MLLLAGADRDQPDGAGRTPLWLAAAAGESECVEVLISGGVDRHCADDEGRTAVHAAAAAGRELPLRQLLNARAAADAVDASGSQPIHLAAAAGDVPSLRALLSASASVFAVDGAGRTPRQIAAACPGHAAAELYLLAVESTARAFPGRPTRAELLAGDGALAGVYRLACQAQAAAGKGGQEQARVALGELCGPLLCCLPLLADRRPPNSLLTQAAAEAALQQAVQELAEQQGQGDALFGRA